MFQYRVTKYNPKNRDINGHYLSNEWISFSDIGRPFDSGVLSSEEYYAVESKYVSAAINFFLESETFDLRIVNMETRNSVKINYAECEIISTVHLKGIIQDVLRDILWCRLESNNAFLHFGYDYYMYIGCQNEPTDSIKKALEDGLFVEEFCSPYLCD
jgi:hypothetical protein